MKKSSRMVLVVVMATIILFSSLVGCSDKGHDHEFGIWKLEKVPTKDEGGTLIRTCTKEGCEETETFDIPKLNKDEYEYSIKRPTCISLGKEEYLYEKDGQEFKIGIEIKKIDHKFSTWEVLIEPTLEKEGQIVRMCTQKGCGHSETFILPILNETDYKVIKDEVSGSRVYVYEKDGEEFSFTPIQVMMLFL